MTATQPLGSIPLEEITIPERAGTIVATHWPKTACSGTVICIEELPVNYGVQNNIMTICEHLTRTWDLRLLCHDGATGVIEVDAMRRTGETSIRRAAADSLLKRGLMPGAMAFAVINADLNIVLVGIDDDILYKKNLDA